VTGGVSDVRAAGLCPTDTEMREIRGDRAARRSAERVTVTGAP